MKIKRLMVENLTSLRGRHEIDFQNDLSGADLFAITGPTGSGKSSLLNAISLALYGRSAKSELSSQDFVATDTAKARVHLEFQHMRSVYLATWSCRRLTQNGKSLKRPQVKRELFSYDLEALDWTPISSSPEAILQLTYEQFTRSVVLNQGEFAQFLTSSFSERRQILERIYSGENLQALKTILNEKLKSTQTQKEIIDQKDQGLMPFSEEHYLELKQAHDQNKKEDLRLAETSKLLQKLDTEFQRFWQALEGHLNTCSKLRDLEAQFSQQTEQVNQNKRLKNQSEQQLKRSVKRYKEERPLLEKIQQSTLELARQEQFLKELTQRLEDAKNSEQDKKSQLIKIQNEHDELNLSIVEIKKNLPQKIVKGETKDKEEISIQLERFLKIGHELKEHYQSLAQEQRLAEREIELKMKQLKRVKEDAFQAQHSRKKLEESHTKLLGPYQNLEEINKRWQTAQVENKDLQFKEKTHSELNQNIQKIKTELEGFKEKHALLEKQLEKLDSDIHEIERWKELNELQSSLESCIKQSLQDGECYVCGHEVTQKILEHPMLKNNYSPDLTKLKELYQERQEMQKMRDRHKIQQQDLVQKLQRSTKDLAEIKDSLTQTYQSWNIDPDKENPHDTFKKITSGLESQITQVHKSQQLLDQNQAKFNETKQTQLSLEKELNQRKQAQEQLKEKLEKTKEKMRAQKKQVDSIALSSESTLEDYEFIYTKLKELLSEEAHKKQLSSYAQQIEKDLEKIKESINKETSSLKRTQGGFQELADQNKVTLKKLSLSPPTTETQHILELVENQLQELEKETEHKQKQLNEDTQKLQTTEQQLSQTRGQLSLQKERLKELGDLFAIHQSNFINQLEQLKGQRPQTELSENWQAKFSCIELEELTNEQRDALQAFYEDKLLALLDEVQIKLNKVKEKFQESKAQIELYESRLKQREELLKQTDELDKKLAGLQKLHSLIGKDEFRNFALAMIERDLIQQTNLELEKICQGRYRIDFAITARAQEFSLIDYWQGAQQRKISTLSGGETFLVSLAMALSLAEMSRGETEINSFFIDEGFGSLDQDSLEEVIETLSHVRSRGKQIGIISHVKELTQRIDINIDLVKNQHGESQIQLLYN